MGTSQNRNPALPWDPAREADNKWGSQEPEPNNPAWIPARVKPNAHGIRITNPLVSSPKTSPQTSSRTWAHPVGLHPAASGAQGPSANDNPADPFTRARTGRLLDLHTRPVTRSCRFCLLTSLPISHQLSQKPVPRFTASATFLDCKPGWATGLFQLCRALHGPPRGNPTWLHYQAPHHATSRGLTQPSQGRRAREVGPAHSGAAQRARLGDSCHPASLGARPTQLVRTGAQTPEQTAKPATGFGPSQGAALGPQEMHVAAPLHRAVPHRGLPPLPCPGTLFSRPPPGALAEPREVVPGAHGCYSASSSACRRGLFSPLPDSTEGTYLIASRITWDKTNSKGKIS